MRDLSQAYQNILKNGEALLSAPKATYVNFAEWQRERLSKNSPVRQNLATYLKSKFCVL